MPIVNPGIRRQVAGAITRLFNSASFYAPLTHSAIPERAATGTTGSFTRATTKTVENNDGYLVTLLAGEIGFPGARRVRNLMPATSENILDASFDGNTSATRNNATTVTAAANNQFVGAVILTNPAGDFTASVKITRVTGTGDIQLSANAGATYTTVPVTTTPTRFQVTATGVAAGFGAPIVRITTAGDSVKVEEWQIEDVTAQTTQTASEYVSVGVESAPYYHGSFVDGVKCFPTDLSGNPIPSTTLLGYQAQGAGTNLCLQSENLGTTWANSNQTVATNQIAAPDGTTSADKLTANAGSLAKESYQPIVVTAAAHTFSFFAKAGTASWIGCSFAGGEATTDGAFFNISSGVVGTVAAGTTASIAAYADGWYRCSMTRTLSAGTSYAQVQIHTADNQARTWAAAGTETLYVWGAQVELGSFASSYIATTTIAVARNADVLTYSSAGNFSETAGWAYMEVDVDGPASGIGNSLLLGSVAGAVSPLLLLGSATQTSIRDTFGTSASKTGLSDITTATRKRGSTWGGTTMKVTGDGLSPTSGVYAGSFSLGASFGIGCSSNGSLPTPGIYRNVRLGLREISSSELQAVTA